MACRVGSFSTGTGAVSSTVAVTGTGFTPAFVLFWWNGRTDTTDAAGSASHVSGFGAMSATERIVVVAHSTDAGASAEADAGQRTDACIASMSAAGAIDGLLDFSSFDSDGFTLVVDDVMPVSLRVHYMAFDSAITNVDMGFFTEPAATGTQDITAPGFQPDAAFFMSFSNNTGDPPMTGTDSRRSFGVAAGATPANYVWCGGSNDAAATMQTLSYCRSGDAIAGMEGAVTTTNMRGRVSAWLSNGFRITWDEVTGNNVRRILYVALKGGSWFAGDLTTATNTTAFGETGVGFQPEGVLFVSHNNSASTSDTAQDHESLSIGAADSSLNQAACALIDEDNTANAEVATAVEHDEVYINLDTADAKEGGMKLNSMDSDGFTVQMTDADPSALFVWYVAWRGVVSIAPSGITSAEAFGTAALSIDIVSQSIASAEAFGTAVLTLNVTAQAISSAEAFGSASLSIDIAAQSIASTETFGTPSLAVDVTIVTTSITSAEAFGTALLTLFLTPAAIDSAEAFGSASIVPGAVSILPVGIDSAETIPQPRLDLNIVGTGIASAEAFGTAELGDTAQSISATGIASTEAFGTALMSVDVSPTGIASLEAFGTLQIDLSIIGTGIASAEAFGSSDVAMVVGPSAIASAEAFGAHTVLAGDVTIAPSSITSAEAFGTASVERDGDVASYQYKHNRRFRNYVYMYRGNS